MNINDLWYSKNESLWESALENYWHFVKPANRSLEERMEILDSATVRVMSVEDFYNFIIDDYFQWKYTDSRWLNSVRNLFASYVTQERLVDLEDIKQRLFSFDLNDIEKGLYITKEIRGLGTAGASGLLSILFPEYFATVDQFVVKALCTIEGLPEKMILENINPDNLSIRDAVVLIRIMKNKAAELNAIFDTQKWTPRDIDKILWSTRNGEKKSQDIQIEDQLVQQKDVSNLTAERKSQHKSFNMPNQADNDFNYTRPTAISILEMVKETFKECEIGTELTRQEIVDKVVLKYGCNPSSIIPSDYCYNRLNNGIDFRNYLHIFEYLNRSSYKYLGENYPYNGKVYHKPKSGQEIVVGEWVNGAMKLKN